MGQDWDWRCGWCKNGPMPFLIEHCTKCLCPKDANALPWNQTSSNPEVTALSHLRGMPPSTTMHVGSSFKIQETNKGFSSTQTSSNPEATALSTLRGISFSPNSSHPETKALCELTKDDFGHSSKSRETNTILPIIHKKSNPDRNPPLNSKSPETRLKTHISLRVSYGNAESSIIEHETDPGPRITPPRSTSKPKAVSRHFTTPGANCYPAVLEENDQNDESSSRVVLPKKGNTFPHRPLLLRLPAIGVIGGDRRKPKVPADTSAEISGFLRQEMLHPSSNHESSTQYVESKRLREGIPGTRKVSVSKEPTGIYERVLRLLALTIIVWLLYMPMLWAIDRDFIVLPTGLMVRLMLWL
jgi:hypothetical protein